MNVFGMGMLEVLVILVIAFLVLGPSKTIDTAKTVGKVIRDVRRVASDITEAASFELDGKEKPAAPPQPPLPPPAGAAPTQGAAAPAEPLAPQPGETRNG